MCRIIKLFEDYPYFSQYQQKSLSKNKQFFTCGHALFCAKILSYRISKSYFMRVNHPMYSVN